MKKLVITNTKLGKMEINNIDLKIKGNNIYIIWESNIGTGEIKIYRKNNKLYIDSELMGKEFAKKILFYLLDNSIME
ncbi:MAG: hypothetical protein ACOCP8_01215 [archaeon]